MEFHAEIGSADDLALRRHLHERAERQRRRPSFAILVGAWAVLAVLFTWLYTATTLPPGYILSCGLGIALGFFLAARVLQLSAAPPATEGATLGEHAYRLDEDGLHVRTAAWDLTLRRDAIAAVEETPEHFFLHTAAGTTLIVPQRAFASREESEAFGSGVRTAD